MRTEVHHFTREQVLEHTRETLAILAEADVDAELRPVAFECVFDRLTAKQIVMDGAPPALAIPIVPRL